MQCVCVCVCVCVCECCVITVLVHLQKDKYKMLCDELRASQDQCEWTVKGPPNKRQVHVIQTRFKLSPAGLFL